MSTESVQAPDRVESEGPDAPARPKWYQFTVKAAPKPVKPVARAGAMPQVSLLPRDLRAGTKGRAVKVLLVAAVVGSAVAVAGGVGWASTQVSAAQAQAQNAQSTGAALNAQVAKYTAMEQFEQRIGVAKAAVRVGSSTAIDWQSKIQQIVNMMPAGWSVSSIGTSGATPFADYAQGSSPLDSPRVATISVTANAPSLAALPTWLAALPAVQGYTDVTPTVSTDSASTGGYQVTVVVHLSDAAYITQLNEESAK